VKEMDIAVVAMWSLTVGLSTPSIQEMVALPIVTIVITLPIIAVVNITPPLQENIMALMPPVQIFIHQTKLRNQFFKERSLLSEQPPLLCTSIFQMQ
jgi:hypothetical protein